VAKPEGQVIFRRPRRRWEKKIKLNLNKIGWERVGWTDLAQARDKWRALVNVVINVRTLDCILNSWKPIHTSNPFHAFKINFNTTRHCHNETTDQSPSLSLISIIVHALVSPSLLHSPPPSVEARTFDFLYSYTTKIE